MHAMSSNMINDIFTHRFKRQKIYVILYELNGIIETDQSSSNSNKNTRTNTEFRK